jgi:hypothetical protein
MADVEFKGVAVEEVEDTSFKGVAIEEVEDETAFKGVAIETDIPESSGFAQIIRKNR